MQAQDIMTRRVITVGLATQVPEIADLLITHQISGVPVVHLWGLLDTEAARSALRVAAETTPGVVRVEDHTSIPAYS